MRIVAASIQRHHGVRFPPRLYSGAHPRPLPPPDKRPLAMSRDDPFPPGDRILAVNREPLSATSDRALHELLVRYPPDATMTVRVLRAEAEVDVSAPCMDSKEYYAPLRAAVTAPSHDDVTPCD